jgi:hypothetical protein
MLDYLLMFMSTHFITKKENHNFAGCGFLQFTLKTNRLQD